MHMERKQISLSQIEPNKYRSGEKTKVYNVYPAPSSEEGVKKLHEFLKAIKERT